MSKACSTDLIELIKSLSPVEKAYIKKFAFRSSAKGDHLYLSLFNDIDKQKVYNEKLILKNSKYAGQLPQLKKYLYSAICKALDSYHAESSTTLQLIKMISMIEILYGKGLEAQCWKLLVKAKKIALAHEMYIYVLELLRWEWLMSSPTSRKFGRELEEIYSEEQKYLQNLKTISNYRQLVMKLLNFASSNHSIRANNKLEELKKITSNPLFKKKTPVIWQAKLFFYEMNGHFFGLIGNYHQSYHYRRESLNLFESFPEKKLQLPISFLSVLNNYFMILVPLKKYQEIEKCIAFFRSVGKTQLSAGIREGLFVLYSNILDFYLKRGEFGDGEKLIKEMDPVMEQYQGKISEKMEIAIFINSAIIYFGAGNFSSSLYLLNKIFSIDSSNHRKDIVCFARILNLIIHFELGNVDMLEYVVKSTYRFLYKKGGLYKFETAILHFIKNKISKSFNDKELKQAFSELKEELEEIVKEPLEQKALASFDFICWLESKIENRPFREIFQKKVLN